MGQLLVGVLTCSDRCAKGTQDDTSGRAIIDYCADRDWDVVAYDVCEDDVECIVASLIDMSDVEEADIVLTTGGTGVGPRDVTPESTLKVAEREVPGIAEAIRQRSLDITDRAMLSRGVAVQRGRTLIINLPGSEKAVRETLGIIGDQLEHARDMMAGAGHD